MFRKTQNMKGLTVILVLGLLKQCSRVQIFSFFVERILMDRSYILWNKCQDYQLRFILTNHSLVILTFIKMHGIRQENVFLYWIFSKSFHRILVAEVQKPKFINSP